MWYEQKNYVQINRLYIDKEEEEKLKKFQN